MVPEFCESGDKTCVVEISVFFSLRTQFFLLYHFFLLEDKVTGWDTHNWIWKTRLTATTQCMGCSCRPKIKDNFKTSNYADRITGNAVVGLSKGVWPLIKWEESITPTCFFLLDIRILLWMITYSLKKTYQDLSNIENFNLLDLNEHA